MVETVSLDPTGITAERLVDFLENDGYPVEAAVWTTDDADRWRLYIVPTDHSETDLRSTIRVAYTMSKHSDELPDRDELLYSVVGPDHPVVRALKALNLGEVRGRRKISGVYGNGYYIDKAYVFRLH